MNDVEIERAITDLAEWPFDSWKFPYAFLQAFGNKTTAIPRLRTGTANKSDLGGVLHTSHIHILAYDADDVAEKLSALRNSPATSKATSKAKARFVLATDGVEFEAEDISNGETVAT